MIWREVATTAAMSGKLLVTICAGLVDSSSAVECSTCSMIESSNASQSLSCVSIESLSREVASRLIWSIPKGCSMRGPMICKTLEITHCVTEVPPLSETHSNMSINCEMEVPPLSETHSNMSIHCEIEVPPLSEAHSNMSIHCETEVPHLSETHSL